MTERSISYFDKNFIYMSKSKFNIIKFAIQGKSSLIIIIIRNSLVLYIFDWYFHVSRFCENNARDFYLKFFLFNLK